MVPPCQTRYILGSIRAAGRTAAEDVAGAVVAQAAAVCNRSGGARRGWILQCWSIAARAQQPSLPASLPMCMCQRAWQAKRCPCTWYLLKATICRLLEKEDALFFIMPSPQLLAGRLITCWVVSHIVKCLVWLAGIPSLPAILISLGRSHRSSYKERVARRGGDKALSHVLSCCFRRECELWRART